MFVDFMFELVMQNGLADERELLFALTNFVVSLFIMTIVFYIAGRIVVGGKRALFSDAFIISFLGSILSTACVLFLPWKIIGVILAFVLWLSLIRRFYETGWLGAIAVAIMAVIVYVGVLVVVGFLFGLSLAFLFG